MEPSPDRDGTKSGQRVHKEPHFDEARIDDTLLFVDATKPQAEVAGVSPAPAPPGTVAKGKATNGASFEPPGNATLPYPPSQALCHSAGNDATRSDEEPAEGFARYAVIRLIGKGGPGAVYLAQDRKMGGRLVALKTPRVSPQDPGYEQYVARFKREARITALLSEQYKVVAYDFEVAGCAGQPPFIALEYVPGEDLSQLAARGVECSSQPDYEAIVWDCVDVIRHAALALQGAHDAGVVHRDIKPQNIRCDLSKPERRVYKVLDWGLAKVRNEDEFDACFLAGTGSKYRMVDDAFTAVGVMMGTPRFVAPEQQRDAAAVDHRADIYSLGATLMNALAGRAPQQGGSAFVYTRSAIDQEIRHELARHRLRVTDRLSPLVSIAAKAMSHDPDHRYQRADELARDLKRWLERKRVCCHTYGMKQSLARYLFWRVAGLEGMRPPDKP